MNPLVPCKQLETTTVTLNEIIYQRRVPVLDHAGTNPITETCRIFGISRHTYYRWADRAARYGLAALMPKARRAPVMPNGCPPHVVEIVLAEAVARPTTGRPVVRSLDPHPAASPLIGGGLGRLQWMSNGWANESQNDKGPSGESL